MSEESNIIKVIFSETAPYENFAQWLKGLSENEMSMWTELLNKDDVTEVEFDLIAKKAIELYCLDMNIGGVPSDEDYIRKILAEFTTLFFMYKLQQDGFVKIYGELSFGVNLGYEMTKEGIDYVESTLNPKP